MLNTIAPASLPRFILLANKFPIYPVLGIMGTLLGTLIALALIPENSLPAGQLADSAIVMTVGLGLAPALASLRNIQTILRAEHLLVLAPIYWLLLDLLQGSYDLVLVDKADVESAFIAIGLFVGGVWITMLFPPRSLPRVLHGAASYNLTPKLLFKIILIFFTLCITYFAYPCNFDPVVMFNALGAERFSAPWSSKAVSSGAKEAILAHLIYFGYLLPTLTVLFWLRSRRLSFQVIISIVLCLIVAVFLGQSGGRRIIGILFGAAIICWILEQQKLGLRRLLIVIASTVILLTVMQYMLEFRGGGAEAFFQKGGKLQQKHLHVDDNFLRLGQIIDIVPDKHPFVYEKQIIFALIRPVPRSLWPGKPLTPGFALNEVIGLKNVSLTSSVIGEWYYSYGWIGVFVGGLLYGRLASLASLLLIKEADSAGGIVYSLVVMALFVGMRSMIELVLTSYTILAWIGISWLMLRQQRLKLHNV